MGEAAAVSIYGENGGIAAGLDLPSPVSKSPKSLRSPPKVEGRAAGGSSRIVILGDREAKR